jgi:2-methylisocitrate lyase-like PEP mutase family enzyme
MPHSDNRPPIDGGKEPRGRHLAEVAEVAGLLRRLHAGPEILVLANCWDVGSAQLTEELGFPAVATSSGAIARALGERDNDSMAPDLAFDAIARISAGVSVPVTADIEAGYQLTPGELVGRLLDAGAVGCNLEDSDHHGDHELVDAELQAERIRAVKEAAHRAGADIVLNARIDVHLRQLGTLEEQVAEAIRRGCLYLEGGADCVYPIGLGDAAMVRRVVDAVPGPVNILLRAGAPPLPELGRLGVARVSVGSGLLRVAMSALRTAAQRLRSGDATDFA